MFPVGIVAIFAGFSVEIKKKGSTGIWTRDARIKTSCADHYTMEPVPTVGFEPTRWISPDDLKSSPLDLSGKLTVLGAGFDPATFGS